MVYLLTALHAYSNVAYKPILSSHRGAVDYYRRLSSGCLMCTCAAAGLYSPQHLLLLVILLLCHGLNAAQTAYPGCPDVPPDWFPDCQAAVYARVQVGGDRVFYWTPYTSARWGNVLSPYWQARALAELAGHGFNAYSGFDSSWLKYLPKELPPQQCPDLKSFKKACSPESCKHVCKPALRAARGA